MDFWHRVYLRRIRLKSVTNFRQQKSLLKFPLKVEHQPVDCNKKLRFRKIVATFKEETLTKDPLNCSKWLKKKWRSP